MIRLSLMPAAWRDHRTRMQPILEPWYPGPCHSPKAPEFGRGSRRHAASGLVGLPVSEMQPRRQSYCGPQALHPFEEEGEQGLLEKTASYPLFPTLGDPMVALR